MSGTVLTEQIELTHGGDPGGGAGDARGDGGAGREGGFPATPLRIYQTGVWLALAAIIMFFMALVSAYIVRKGLGGDWRPLDLPRILWLNTAVLILSSVTLERARRAFSRDDAAQFRLWWCVTTGLGLAFLAGQYAAWRQMAAAGVYLATNPSSSFFYLLTAAHAAHLLGGIAALSYVLLRGWAHLRRRNGIAAEATGVYWHFMDGLWVFLLLVLQMGR
jgi:cytochrome c oxidase subunit III